MKYFSQHFSQHPFAFLNDDLFTSLQLLKTYFESQRHQKTQDFSETQNATPLTVDTLGNRKKRILFIINTIKAIPGITTDKVAGIIQDLTSGLNTVRTQALTQAVTANIASQSEQAISQMVKESGQSITPHNLNTCLMTLNSFRLKTMPPSILTIFTQWYNKTKEASYQNWKHQLHSLPTETVIEFIQHDVKNLALLSQDSRYLHDIIDPIAQTTNPTVYNTLTSLLPALKIITQLKNERLLFSDTVFQLAKLTPKIETEKNTPPPSVKDESRLISILTKTIHLKMRILGLLNRFQPESIQEHPITLTHLMHFSKEQRLQSMVTAIASNNIKELKRIKSINPFILPYTDIDELLSNLELHAPKCRSAYRYLETWKISQLKSWCNHILMVIKKKSYPEFKLFLKALYQDMHYLQKTLHQTSPLKLIDAYKKAKDPQIKKEFFLTFPNTLLIPSNIKVNQTTYINQPYFVKAVVLPGAIKTIFIALKTFPKIRLTLFTHYNHHLKSTLDVACNFNDNDNLKRSSVWHYMLSELPDVILFTIAYYIKITKDPKINQYIKTALEPAISYCWQNAGPLNLIIASTLSLDKALIKRYCRTQYHYRSQRIKLEETSDKNTKMALAINQLKKEKAMMQHKITDLSQALDGLTTQHESDHTALTALSKKINVIQSALHDANQKLKLAQSINTNTRAKTQSQRQQLKYLTNKNSTLKQTASRHHKETEQRKHHFNTLVSEALKLCQYSQHNTNLINQFQSQYPQQKQQLIMTQQHLYSLQYQLTEAYHTIDYLNTQNQYYGHAHASGLYQPIYPTCPPLLTYAQGSKHQHRIPLSSQSPVLHPQKYRHTVFQPTLFINQSRTHTFQPSSIEIAYHCRQIISILSQPTASFHLFSKGNMQHYSHQNGYADIDIVACPVNDTHQQYGLPIIAKASLIQQLISAEGYHAIIVPTRADLINAKLSTVSEQGHPIEFDLSIYFLRHNEPACYFWHRIVCEHSVSSHSHGLTPLHDYQTHFILGNTFIPLNTVGLYCLTERDLPFWLKEIHRALQHHHVIAPSLIEKVTSLINNVNPNESVFSFFKTPHASHLHLFPEPIFQALTLKFGPFPEPDQQHDELKSPHATLEQNRNSPTTRRSTLTFFTPNSKTTEDLMHTQLCYL